MPAIRYLLMFLSATVLLGPQLAAEARFTLEALPATPIPATKWVAPWLDAAPTDWNSLTPQYVDAAQTPGGNQIKAWVAVTNQKILLHVVVVDDVQFNDRHGGDIWDGDNLQIGIDALGDGAGSAPPGTRLVGPDDIELAAALGADGETLWAHFHGRAGGEGLMPKEYRSIVRDERAHTTTYDLRIPWAELQAAAGASSVIGIRILNNDRDTAGGPRTGLNWTTGENRTRPGLFNRLRLGEPPAELVQFGPPARFLWRADDHAEIPLYVASARAFTLTVKAGGATQTFPLPAAADRAVRRYAVRYFPGTLSLAPLGLEVSVMDAGKTEVAHASATLEVPAVKVAALRARLEQLALAAGHPLLARHWRNISELVAVEWSRAMALVQDRPAEALLTLGYLDEVAGLLEKEQGGWSDYASGDRPLMFAFASSYDRSLQPFYVRLAEKWDVAHPYPLVVDLHGAGNEHPLNFILEPLRPTEPPPAGETKAAATSEPFVTILPWGRGNRGYVQAAETDVWDAIATVAATLALDPDRYYLTGFSMGGDGTWQIGTRQPDRWAALCIDAGEPWSAPLGLGLGGNVSTLPVRIAHGTADGAVPIATAYAFQAELQQYGVKADMRIIEGMGHTRPAWLAAESVNWLLQFRRKRPANFSFMADTDEHRGAWGVWLERDLAVSALPRFHCEVEGNTVRLKSEGAKRLHVELGPDGLGLAGEVVVVWNDREAYRGPVKGLDLGP